MFDLNSKKPSFRLTKDDFQPLRSSTGKVHMAKGGPRLFTYETACGKLLRNMGYADPQDREFWDCCKRCFPKTSK